MVETSGGRSQLAHLATAAVVALVLLFLTGPLQYLPRCVLGAIVFTIAVGLVDLRGLRDILRESPGEFQLALATAAVVVVIGVEQGILLAMVLSLLRHVRHSYRPHTAVLVEDGAGQWRPTAAVPGALSGPGLVVFQFGADLFYANVGRFAEDVRSLIERAPTPVKLAGGGRRRHHERRLLGGTRAAGPPRRPDPRRRRAGAGTRAVVPAGRSGPPSPDRRHRYRSYLRQLARAAGYDTRTGCAYHARRPSREK